MVCTEAQGSRKKETKTKMTVNSKLLVLDIEWRPTKAYVWEAWKQDITPDKIIEHGGLLCFAAKWLGEREVMFYADWTEGGHQGMLDAAHKLISNCDGVLTYNGDKYDIPKLMGEFALARMTPPPMPTSIDVLKTIKKLGFFMNRLAFIGPLFEVGNKIANGGFSLWVDVEKGKPSALRRMERYNKQDVRLLEKLYKRILPYIRNHPHLGDSAHQCGACQSNDVQKRGFRRTKVFRIQRLHCQSCGSWQEGTRSKIK